jgi:ribulose-phosphate 3-epimerase|tara:strand:- start:726 stop:1313 length:588 start_codon:yes stop_codon:yes gene_type:complete
VIVSASIQAADQLNIIQDINQNKSKFDQIHVDITDGHFTNNISMSFQHIKEVKKQTDYQVDVQLMVNDNVKLAPLAFDHGADLVCVHYESTKIDDFIKLSKQYKNIGIATLPDTNNESINDYLIYSKAVLLLAVNPGFSNQGQAINLIDKIQNFNNLYPNFNGQLIADGGIKRIDLQDLESNKVDIAVQGGAIFN